MRSRGLAVLGHQASDHKWLGIVCVVSLAIRVLWVLIFQAPPISDAAGYDGLGWRLASGLGYTASDGVTPTAYRPAGYPAFLSMVYLAFGHSVLVAGIANAVLGIAAVALTYRLAREFLPAGPSLVAATVVAFLPSHIIGFTSVLRNEMLHLVFVLAALIVLCRLLQSPTWRNAVMLGIVIGIGVYVRPILLLFPMAVIIPLALRKGLPVGRAVMLACAVTVVSLAILAPWTVRNYLVMGDLVLTSTNGGITFYVGNGPGATGKHRRIDRARTFSDTAEMVVYRESVQLALAHMVDNPDEWISLLPIKFFNLWASDKYSVGPHIIDENYHSFVPALQVVAQVYWTVVALVALIALCTCSPGKWLRLPAMLLPATLVYWTVFHVLIHSESRYHMQVIPVVMIVAAHLLTREPARWMAPWKYKRTRNSSALKDGQ